MAERRCADLSSPVLQTQQINMGMHILIPNVYSSE